MCLRLSKSINLLQSNIEDTENAWFLSEMIYTWWMFHVYVNILENNI